MTLRLPGAIPMLPFAAEERRKLLILSPFLCDAFIDSLAAVPSADRTLITFSDVKTNAGLKDEDLNLVVPKGTKESRPLEGVTGQK